MSENTGIGGVMGNKGGLVVKMVRDAKETDARSDGVGTLPTGSLTDL
jgi:hypothetical protein